MTVVVGHPVGVELVVATLGDRELDATDAVVPVIRGAAVRTASSESNESNAARLDPRFTFDAFVSASSNRLPLAAAQTVAETPGKAYNPLFIYGASGLGKTHLLHAIGNYVQDNYSKMRVLYVTTEHFLNDFIDAIRNKTTLAFKRQYRECDVLLIDDIQFIQGREGLQEELFHTYNTLQGAGQADRPHLGPDTEGDRHPRRAAAQPSALGAAHRDRPSRPRDPPRDPADQGRVRPDRAPRRRGGVHREPRPRQHPGARGRDHPGERLREPQPRADHPRPRQARAVGPRRRDADDHPRRDRRRRSSDFYHFSPERDPRTASRPPARHRPPRRDVPHARPARRTTRTR